MTACFRVLAAAGGWAGMVTRSGGGCSRRAGLRYRCVRGGRGVPRAGDACPSSCVAAGAAVRRDGGDRGHAGAGCAGPGVPVDRGRERGAGGHGAGQAAPVPLLGGAGAGFFTRLAGILAMDPVPLDPAGSGPGDAVVAVAAAGAAAAGRWPELAVSGWELAAVVTAGSLLPPSVAFRRVGGDLPLLALA